MATAIDYLAGMDYGVGIDHVSGETRGDAVNRTPAQSVAGAGGQQTQYVLEQIETIEDLYSSLAISTKGGGSFLGIASGSAKASYANQSNIHQFALYFCISVNVLNSFRRMRDITLKPEALELIRSNRMDVFRNRYGDGFVEGMWTGGCYLAMFSISARDEADHQAIAARVRGGANLGVVSANAAVQFNHVLTEIGHEHRVSASIFQVGGIANPVSSPDEAFEQAFHFPGSVAGDQGVPIQVTVTDYNRLPIPTESNWVDYLNAMQVMEDMFAKRNLLLNLRNDIDYILFNTEEFINPDISALNAARNSLNTQINDITRAASRCANNLMNCDFPAIEIPEAAANLPPRRGADAYPVEAIGRVVLPYPIHLIGAQAGQGEGENDEEDIDVEDAGQVMGALARRRIPRVVMQQR